jgi:hypothetical protein
MDIYDFRYTYNYAHTAKNCWTRNLQVSFNALFTKHDSNKQIRARTHTNYAPTKHMHDSNIIKLMKLLNGAFIGASNGQLTLVQLIVAVQPVDQRRLLCEWLSFCHRPVTAFCSLSLKPFSTFASLR